MKSDEKKRITILLPPDEWKAVKIAAAQFGKSASTFIAEIVEKVIKLLITET